MLSGRADFGVGNTEVLTSYASGQPLLALASVYQHSPSIFLARRDSGILTVDDMRGKRIMMFSAHQDAELLATLFYQGLNEHQLIPLPTSVNIEDLIEGRVDIFNAYLSNEPFYLEERGIPVSVINPRNYGIDFYSDILFTTQAQERAHPDRVARFRAASLAGWRYALAHPQEAIALLRKEYGVNRSQAHMEYELQVSKEMIQPLYVEIGYMNPDRMTHIMQQLVEIGLVSAGLLARISLSGPFRAVDLLASLVPAEPGGLRTDPAAGPLSIDVQPAAQSRNRPAPPAGGGSGSWPAATRSPACPTGSV